MTTLTNSLASHIDTPFDQTELVNNVVLMLTDVNTINQDWEVEESPHPPARRFLRHSAQYIRPLYATHSAHRRLLMIDQTDLVHNVLSLSSSFEVSTINNEPLEADGKHDVLTYQWFAGDYKENTQSLVAELTASLMGSHWIGVRAA